MNCRPGDLALIVGSSLPNDPDIGKIVRVITAIPSDGEPCWGVECSVPLLVSYPLGELGYARGATVADRDLRPIRGERRPTAGGFDRFSAFVDSINVQFSEGKQRNALQTRPVR